MTLKPDKTLLQHWLLNLEKELNALAITRAQHAFGPIIDYCIIILN